MTTRQTENDPEEQSDIRHAVKRRGLIAGAAALVAGVMAKQTSQPVGAETDDTRFVAYGTTGIGFHTLGNFEQGVNATGSTYGVLGSGDGNTGIGVIGYGSGTSPGVKGTGGDRNGGGYGTYGIGGPPNGSGVRGDGQGTAAGVVGAGGNTGGMGLGGYGGDNSGTGVIGSGGYGNGTGVAGYGSGTGPGLVGGGGPGGGTGVQGYAGSDSGTGIFGITNTGIGVLGTAARGASQGVYGQHTGGGYGVYGESVNGRGIYGTTPNGFGVEGISTSFYGVVGRSTTSIGVFGSITGGSAPGTLAINGTNQSTGANSHGIVGVATVGHGLVGTTNFSGGGPPYYAGLVGNAPNGAYAGLFFGNVSITGTLNGHTAIMQHTQVAVAHSDGSHRLAQAVISPEGWMEDFGKGALTNGQAAVKIDPAFAALADMSDYHVFLTTYDDHRTLTVSKQTAGGFVVLATSGELSAGPAGAVQGSGKFGYRVVAKRKDGQPQRLAAYTFPKTEAPKNPSPLTHPPTAATGEVVTPTIPPLPPAPPKPPELPKNP